MAKVCVVALAIMAFVPGKAAAAPTPEAESIDDRISKIRESFQQIDLTDDAGLAKLDGSTDLQAWLDWLRWNNWSNWSRWNRWVNWGNGWTNWLNW